MKAGNVILAVIGVLLLAYGVSRALGWAGEPAPYMGVMAVMGAAIAILFTVRALRARRTSTT